MIKVAQYYPMDWIICRYRDGGGFIIVSPKEIYEYLEEWTYYETVGSYLVRIRQGDYREGDMVFTKWWKCYRVDHTDGHYVYCTGGKKSIVFPIKKKNISRHVPRVNQLSASLIDWDNATTDQAWSVISKISG